MLVAITDMHPVARLGLRIVLNATHFGSVVWEAASSSEMMLMLKVHETDLLIVDCHTLGSTTACAASIREIRETFPALPIVALTNRENSATASVAIAAGAGIAVSKEARPSDIVSACRKANMLDHTPMPRPAILTSLELRTVQLLSTGKTISDISRMTSRRRGAVSKIKSNAMRKLGVTSNIDLHAIVRSWNEPSKKPVGS